MRVGGRSACARLHDVIGVGVFGLFFLLGIGSLVLSIMTAVEREQVSGLGVSADRRRASSCGRSSRSSCSSVCGIGGGVMGMIWFSSKRRPGRSRSRGRGGPAVRTATAPPPPAVRRSAAALRHSAAGIGAAAPPRAGNRRSPPPPPGYPPPPTSGATAAVAFRHGERRHPAVPRRGSRRGARRPARAAGAHALARPDPGLAVGTTAPISRTSRTSATLAHEVRLARAGGRGSTAGRTSSPRSTASRSTSSTPAPTIPTRCR